MRLILRKTSLKVYSNLKQQRQREHHLKINVWGYFVIIVSSPYHLLVIEHSVNGLVEAPLRKIQRPSSIFYFRCHGPSNLKSGRERADEK